MTNNEINLNNLSNLTNKIKVILFSIGLNEKYVTFNYLSTLLSMLLFKNNNK